MRWLWWWIYGYVFMLGIVAAAMFSAREVAINRLSTPQSLIQWQAWRDDVRQQQAEPGPVQRRVPKSSEPPALVLMRDYFAVSLVGAMLFATALYWVVAWLVTGVMIKR
jgi:hypothetical protein